MHLFGVVVPMVCQDAILGHHGTAGIHLDLADGTLCLLDEVQVQLDGRRTLYNNRMTDVRLGRFSQIPVGGT